MEIRKTEAVVAVVFLVLGIGGGLLFSGGGAIGDTDLGSSSDDLTPTDVQTQDSTPTEEETQLNTPRDNDSDTVQEELPSVSYGKETNISSDVIEQHLSSLEEAGSFSASQRYQVGEANDSLEPVNMYGASDFNNQRHQFIEERVSAGTREERLTAGGETFARFTVSQNGTNTTQYYLSEQPYQQGDVPPVSPNRTSGALLILADTVDYDFAQEVETDNATIYQFTANGTDSLLNLNESGYVEGQQGTTQQRPTQFSAQMNIDENGIIRTASWSLTAEVENTTVSYQYQFRLETLGSGEIQIPEWTQAAREASERRNSEE